MSSRLGENMLELYSTTESIQLLFEKSYCLLVIIFLPIGLQGTTLKFILLCLEVVHLNAWPRFSSPVLIALLK